MAPQQPGDVRSAVADALRYYRYRGASLASIDSYTSIRTDSRKYRSERTSALQQLSSEDYAEKRGTLWFLHPTAFKAACGDAYAPEFEDVDFYIAFVLAGSGNDSDLVRLIGTFDFVIRTLPTFDELYGGLNRLVSARLVRYRRRLFAPTEQALELFATAKEKSRKSMYDQLVAFQRLIQCPCCGVALKRVTWRVPLTPPQVASALAEYRKRS